MTSKDLKTQLIVDPDAAISYIVFNNPEAVADRLRGEGFTIATEADYGEALNALLAKKAFDKFENALSVPFLTEGVDPGEVLAVKDAAIALNAKAGRNVNKSLDVGALFAGLATGTLLYLQESGQGTVNVGPSDNKPPAPPEKDNTWMWIGIGIGVVILTVVVIVLVKKKG